MANEKRLINANALEFEPDENCIANGVLIWGSRSGGRTMTTVLSALKTMIDNAPTVDAVEVVHGYWVATPVRKLNSKGKVVKYCDYYHCSECGTDRPIVTPYNYCPNCGAKMDGERKDNDF